MSIAALMVDLDDLPSYTQENDINAMYDTSESTLESANHDIVSLDAAIDGLHALALTLESDGELSRDANKYVGLALDAIMGKSKDVYVHGNLLKTHDDVMSLESEKDGILKRLWEMIKRAFAAMKLAVLKAVEKVTNFFDLTIIRRKVILRKLEELKKKLVATNVDRMGVGEPIVISAALNAKLGGTSQFSNIGPYTFRLKNLAKLASTSLKVMTASFEAAIAAATDKGMDPGKLADIGKKIGADNLLNNFSDALPGNKALVLQNFSETPLGVAMSKIPFVKDHVAKNKSIVTAITGDGMSKENPLTKGVTKKELITFIDAAIVVAGSVSDFSTMNKSVRHATSRVNSLSISEKDIKPEDQSAVNILMARKAIMGSPLYTFPPKLAGYLLTTAYAAEALAATIISTLK